MAKSKKESETETTDLGGLNMSAGPPVPVYAGLGFYQIRGKEIPSYGSESAAGLDIRADLEHGDTIMKYDHRNQKIEVTARPKLFIEPGDRVLVPTGLYADIPEGYYLAIHSRSGTSWKEGLILTNGVAVIDSDYVEEIKVSLTNVSGVRVAIEDGDRIAQFVLMPAIRKNISFLNEKPKTKTSRSGGFGSTGVK